MNRVGSCGSRAGPHGADQALPAALPDDSGDDEDQFDEDKGERGGRGFPGIKGLRGEKRVSCQFQRLLYQDLQLVMFRGQVCGEEKALLSFGKTYEKSRLPRAPAAIKN